MKLKNIIFVLTITLPSLVFAGHEHTEVTLMGSDFLFRVLNFSIFVGLIYYLVAEPIKAFFVGRSEAIANRLKEIDAKLEASKKARLLAEENLKKAEEKAKEIIAVAVEEAKLLSANIVEKSNATVTLLEKQALEKQALEAKKATRTTVESLLKEGINSDDIAIDEAKVVSLISNKVA